MKQKRYTGYIVGAVIVLLGIYIITSYNSLVNKDEKVRQTWADVQNTYQRRLDLTPNLVSLVKGLSNFEQTTFVNVADARSKAMNVNTGEVTAENYEQQKRLQDSLAAASNRLIAVVEKYPQLRGTEAYSGLQIQLEGNERRIKVARNDFNAAVQDYNRYVRSFPTSMVAAVFGFKHKEGFTADAGAEKNVEIKF